MIRRGAEAVRVKMRGVNSIAFIVLAAALLSAVPSGSGVNRVLGGNVNMPDQINQCSSLNSSHPCFRQPNCVPTNVNPCSFPPGFIFGASSSAYQVEGAYNIDGKGQSIWDTFTHEHADKMDDKATGDVAVDHYHRYKEDIALMKKMGLDAYRFSISWSRVLPNGKVSGWGVVNQKGMTFYNNLINEIIAQGMKPFVTIFHWDVPQHLEFEYAGFLSDRIVQDFQDYAELLFETFGDRVKHWITLNEPSTFSMLGYDYGANAPGRCSECSYGDSGREPYIVVHNQLLAHAAAVDVYRKKFQATQKGFIGISLSSSWLVPYTNDDIDAQQRGLDFQLGWFMGPITNGDYPESMKKNVGDRLPTFTKDEQNKVKTSIDFLGLNYYTSMYARDATEKTNLGQPRYSTDSHVDMLTEKDGFPLGDPVPGSWISIYPKGLMRLLVHIKENYHNPVIFITENGIDEQNNASLLLEEALKDSTRKEYLQCHLHSLLEAINERYVHVRGYFIWSFMDNLEWRSGYNSRFGVVYIDYKNNLQRYMKDSALWFSELLKPKMCPMRTSESINLKEL